ncbi:hypothetical protein VINI7043_28485 [Vibrio nigripulchritudo ATCC 27043]|uniref:hypothetical protein n=1 Tax=Vibrio nigripulchritudo TaxID=28173 RepID=UPI00021C4134|nr:hypothetical protein [Vibrio nigripulchritudo]EGU61837.1 hypothetical protein VINI7043_28485 [Vibrio nigripulchritudo ATCC 27043]
MQSLIKGPLREIKKDSLLAKLDYTLNKKKLFKEIDRIPETSGAGVVYIDSNFTVVELRKFQSTCRINPINIILREPPKQITPQQFATQIKSSNRESKLVGEAVGAGLSCVSAVIGWVVVVGSSAAIPITGGTSAAVTYLGYAAAVASTAQCAVGGGRFIAEMTNPKGLDWLDSQEWYQNTAQALDLVSLGGVAASGALTIKMVANLRSTTSKSTMEVLKGLNRQERARLTREISRQNLNNVSNKAYKQLLKAGLVKRRHSNMEITKAIRLQLKDAIGASISFTGSASSGTVNALAIGVYEELKFE